MIRPIWLIASGVLIEAIRRKEIYVLVLTATLLIGAVLTVDFFDIEGLSKFYREIALKVMSYTTALAVIVLAARQLPREFEKRTIYPLLARPISRFQFLLGKLFGVMLSAMFCFALFMAIYLLGSWYLSHGTTQAYIGEETTALKMAMLFLQYVYLQILMLLILATMSFWLSMFLNFDAAVAIGAILFIFASLFMSALSYLYDYTSAIGQWLLVGLTFGIPQLSLFDLSDKAVHAWDPLPWQPVAGLTVYALVFSAIFFGLAMLLFRRRAI
ncbi:MAG: ABC transporter permease subunit [Sumerlaeia bacterium]